MPDVGGLLGRQPMCAGAERRRRRLGPPPGPCGKMAKQLAKQMDLDDSTADWFIPLYVEYSDTLRAVRTSPLRSREVDEVSDAEALEAVEAMFAASEREVALKRAYYARFKEKLTGQQVLRVFMPASPKRQSDGNRRPGGFGGPGGFPGGFGGPGGF